MECKKFEILLLRSLDKVLKGEEKEKLEKHLTGCPLCQEKRKQYQTILDILGREELPDPNPYFWERLQAKIKERKKHTFWSSVRQWSIRAVSISLAFFLLLALIIAFFTPPKSQEMSQTEMLLRNQNPLQETRQLLEEEGSENQNMMIIFSVMEAKNGPGRYYP